MPREVKITQGERRVLDVLLDTGKTNAWIASVLILDEDTIKTHLKRMYRKFGVSSRAELIVMVTRKRVRLLIEADDDEVRKRRLQSAEHLAAARQRGKIKVQAAEGIDWATSIRT